MEPSHLNNFAGISQRSAGFYFELSGLGPAETMRMRRPVRESSRILTDPAEDKRLAQSYKTYDQARAGCTATSPRSQGRLTILAKHCSRNDRVVDFRERCG